MGWGGTRSGAGKKKGHKQPKTLEKEAARERVRQRITARLDPLIDAHLAQAEGLKYLVTRDKKTGKFIRVGPAMASKAGKETIEVWEKDPSVEGLRVLLDRALDGPKEQALEMTVDAGKDILAWLDETKRRNRTAGE